MATGPLPSTPAADGFRMPGEFERHRGTWMAWPRRPDNWRADAGPAREAFAAVATAVATVERVRVAVHPDDIAGAARALGPGIELVAVPSDDAWMRDIGPTFVVDDHGGVRGVDWEFNAWGGADGGLYASWAEDDAMAAAVCAAERVDRYRAPFVLEGGSIHADGEGTLLVTEECLLHPNRNPGRSAADLERLLGAYTGATTVIWLGLGVVDDETDGHVDNLCCFVGPGEVLLTWTDDRDDPQHAALERRTPPARGGHRRSGPLARGPPAAPARAAVRDRRGGGRGRRHAGEPTAARRRSPRRVLRQLRSGQRSGRRPAARPPPRRRRPRGPRRLLSRPRGRRGPGAGDPPGRWQRALHHPARPGGNRSGAAPGGRAGTLTRAMVEIGTAGPPFRASTIAVGAALAAETDGAHAIWFPAELTMPVTAEEWRHPGGTAAATVVAPDPSDLADPIVTAAAAVLVARGVRVGVLGWDPGSDLARARRTILTLAELAPGRCVVALDGTVPGAGDLAASCAAEPRIELATVGGDPQVAARGSCGWIAVGADAEVIAKAALDAGVVGRLGVALSVAIHDDVEIARACLDAASSAEGVVVGDPAALVEALAAYVEAGVTRVVLHNLVPFARPEEIEASQAALRAAIRRARLLFRDAS